jgi:hypothetical protein
MNKYASGYALIQFMTVFGAIVVGVSLLGGLMIFFNSEKGMGWVGVAAAVAGTFQGLILMGVAAIGEAILDGSLAQQRAAGQVALQSSVITQSPKVYSASPDYVRVKSYKGHVILKGPSGISIGGVVGHFKNVIEAERHIDEMPESS